MPRKSILVVDDEKPQRDILQEILTSAGYDVTSAASGEAALKFAKDRSFDLALTDLKMTGIDGIELLQQLLALDSSIIVILLTAHGTIDSAKVASRRVRLSAKALRPRRLAGNHQTRAGQPRSNRCRDQIRLSENGSGEEDDSESGPIELDGLDPRRIGNRQRTGRARDS